MTTASPPSRAVVVGEALVDVVAGGAAHAGGSPLNVAVGLARLGVPVELATRMGDDAYGRLIGDHVRAAGVALAAGSLVAGSRTSTAVVTVDDAGRAEYAFELDTSLPAAEVAGARLVHTGSIGAILEPGATAVRDALDRAEPGVLRSYDPNMRPDVMGPHDTVLAKVEALAAGCHVVKLSDEDAAWLYPGVALDGVLARLIELGARLAVVTRGGDGCLALAAGAGGATAPVARPARPVTLVDTIGAGDAFMSGLLYGILHEGADAALAAGRPLDASTLERVLDTALASAAVTVSRAGANPPSPEELAAVLAALPVVE